METTHYELEEMMGDGATWVALQFTDLEQVIRPMQFPTKHDAQLYILRRQLQDVRIILVKTIRSIVE